MNKQTIMAVKNLMLVVLIVVPLDCTLGQIMLDRHKILPGLSLRDSLLWTDVIPRSVVRCALECRHTPRCYAIAVSAETSLCSYYDWWLGRQHPMIMSYAAASNSEDSIILVKPIPGIRL